MVSKPVGDSRTQYRLIHWDPLIKGDYSLLDSLWWNEVSFDDLAISLPCLWQQSNIVEFWEKWKLLGWYRSGELYDDVQTKNHGVTTNWVISSSIPCQQAQLILWVQHFKNNHPYTQHSACEKGVVLSIDRLNLWPCLEKWWQTSVTGTALLPWISNQTWVFILTRTISL